MQRLRPSLILAANSLPLGAVIGVVSGLFESYRQGYFEYGSTSLAIRTIASDTVVGMLAAGIVGLFGALFSRSVRPWLHPRRRWIAATSLVLATVLIFVNPGSVVPPEVIRHPIMIASLCALAIAPLLTRGPLDGSRWARRLAIVPLAAAVLVAVVFEGAVRVRRGRTDASGRPNVVLIVVDTLRADHLGLYGYHRGTSPRLEELASQSTVYRRAYAQAPWTSPSVAALMTSRHPGELGYESSHNPAVLEPRFHTFAELLWEAGYETSAFVSHVFVARKLGFDQGFDRFSDEHARGADYVSSGALIGDSIRYLDAARRPFFLFIHLFDPHFAYIEHPDHRFAGSYSGWVKSGLSISELLRRADDFQPDDLAHLLSLYDSEIRFTDEHIGQLLDGLRQRDLFDDSWIVVVGDHGEAFLDRSDRWIGHGRTLYNELLHVPLIVKRPGQRESRVVDSPVGLVDVLPTVAGEIGLPLPGATAGAALPFGSGDDDGAGGSPRPVFSETKTRGRWLQSAVLGDWKLIVDRETGDVELYDLSSDSGERTDLSSREPELERALMKALDAWDASLGRGERAPSADASWSSEELRNLKALGYLD